MKLIPDAIARYAAMQSDGASLLLEELERETREKTADPQMLTGFVEAKFLQILIRLSGARRVVEVGTFTGYSALVMAEGLPDDGQLFTCEIERRHAAIARRYFRKSPYGRKISLVPGDARKTLAGFEAGSVDFIFIDADKSSYPHYYEEGIRILRKGGLIAVDNTLWYGRVLRPRDADSRAIACFNKAVRSDDRVEKVLLTVRDGITLIRKKE